MPCVAAQQKVVVVVANRLLLSDFDNPSLPTITKMINGGSAALISPNCFGPKNEYSVLLTASAGASCRGDSYVRQCYDINEMTSDQLPSGDVYTATTGNIIGDNTGVFLGLGQAFRENKELSRPIMLGALGESMQKAKKISCAIGNADIAPNGINRSVAVLAMDSRGLIRSSKLGLPSAKSSLGLFSDVNLLASSVKDGIAKSDLVIVDFGDFARLDESKNQFSDTIYLTYKSATMRQLDSFLMRIMNNAQDTKFILASFSPPLSGPWNHLTPIIIYPSASEGLLISPTTRTPGLIATSDFAPTVLDLMRVPAAGQMLGRASKEVSAKNNLASLREMDTRVTANHALIWPVLWIITIIGAASLAISSLSIAFSIALPSKIYSVFRAGMLICACYPLAMLLAVLAPAGIAGYAVGTAISTVTLALISWAIGRKHSAKGLPILIAFGFTTIVILVDILTGGTLCKFAVPSSFQLSGFRYYGIGNEYAAILISMAAIVTLFMFGKNRTASTLAAIIIGVIVVAVLGIGLFGANYGATIAAVVTFGLILLSKLRSKFGFWNVIALFALGLAVSIGFAYIDSKIAGAATTHAGRVAGLVHRFGDQYVFSLVLRKILLNIQLTFSPQSQKAFLAFSPFLALWFYGVQGKVKQMFLGEPTTLSCFKAIAIGAVAAFLFNDSGVVFANIMIGMTVLILLYLLIDNSRVKQK